MPFRLPGQKGNSSPKIGVGGGRPKAESNAIAGNEASNLPDDSKHRNMVMGAWHPLVVVGVAVYVAVAYAFWSHFRAYFDWSESLAITIKVTLNAGFLPLVLLIGLPVPFSSVRIVKI